MICVETVGGIQAAKINPVLTSNKGVKNYDFITVDDVLYLVNNTLGGDAAYREDQTIAAGEYLNGYDVASLAGLKLVVDGKHIAFGTGETISDIDVGDILIANQDGKLVVDDEAPEAGAYFVVTDVNVTLTEAAIKVRVCA